MAVKRWIPKVSDLDGWQGMGEGTDDGYGNAYVLASDYDAQARMLEDAREALKDAAELIEIARGKMGCCGEGDGRDHRATNEFPGSLPFLATVRAILARVPVESAQLDEESLRSKP